MKEINLPTRISMSIVEATGLPAYVPMLMKHYREFPKATMRPSVYWLVPLPPEFYWPGREFIRPTSRCK